MFRRILLDPTAETAGGTSETLPVSAGKAPEAEAAKPPTTRAVPVQEWESLNTRLAAFEKAEAEQKAAAERKERERLEAIAARADAQKEFGKLQEGWTAKETGFKAQVAAKDRTIQSLAVGNEVAQATAGVQWASEHAAKHAMAILKGRFEAVVGDDDAVEVRDRLTGRSASEVVKELLASPEFAHYQAPSTKGKGGTGGGNNAAPSGGQGEAGREPANLGEAIALRFLSAQKASADAPAFGPIGFAGRR